MTSLELIFVRCIIYNIYDFPIKLAGSDICFQNNHHNQRKTIKVKSVLLSEKLLLFTTNKNNSLLAWTHFVFFTQLPDEKTLAYASLSLTRHWCKEVLLFLKYTSVLPDVCGAFLFTVSMTTLLLCLGRSCNYERQLVFSHRHLSRLGSLVF